ncbi:hypothetical protein D0863_04194 [Hortaea werneckii]|uniref:Uncharacterized protein n=1 Tax=Hortaea werneckii TaxID=91943 RepID=A0A3M7E8N5_HORWE|nr:hypothetical protein D0863_04194 [Hortaea werneckii]
MSTVGEVVGILACVDGVVSAYRDGGAIIQLIKVKRAQKRAPPPPRLLEESIDQAPEAIEREKNNGVQKFGRAFEEGDHIAVIALQQITIQLQGTLLEKLRNATLDDDVTTDFTILVDAADLGRDRAIGALLELRQRLLQAAPIHEVAMPEDGRQPQPRLPSFSRESRKGSQDLPLRSTHEPPAQQPQQQQKKLGPERAKTWVRDNISSSRDASGEEDSASGAEVTRSTRKRHSSILGFLHKSQRSQSGSHDRGSKSSDLARRSSTNSPTSAPVPFKPPPRCDARDYANPPNSMDTQRSEGLRYNKDLEDNQSLPRSSETSRRKPERRDTTDSLPGVPPDGPVTPGATRQSLSNALSVARSASFKNEHASSAVPTPTPENDFLGFCKGAWKLQNGDRKAMTKSKEFNEGWSGNSIYLLACTQSKCAFAGHLPLDQIWTKVITVEAKGLKIRWPFLAKSHVQQYKVRREKQYQFQCMFCVYQDVGSKGQGQKRETYTGTDAYLEHVSQTHRGETLGAILMYKTRCITERVAEDTEEFDVNLWPLSVPEQLDRTQAAGVSGEKAAAYTNGGSLEEAQDSGVISEQPWNEGLSEFHWGGELERSERD